MRTIEAPPVGKKRSDVSVKISQEANRLAKTAAAWLGISVNEYLSRAVIAAARKDLARMPKELKQTGSSESEE